jgi:NIMA (never in mitosis gene a)-related kinase
MYNRKYLCIVMNYCCNGDLSSYLKKKRSKKEYLSEEKVLYWFTEICLGLKCIHDNSIVHRDLKTQNIFITGHKNLQIGDFGVCKNTISLLKVLAKQTARENDILQTIIGTPLFQAPEICQQNTYTNKADIWSLGCILYELMALKVPFDATSFLFP